MSSEDKMTRTVMLLSSGEQEKSTEKERTNGMQNLLGRFHLMTHLIWLPLQQMNTSHHNNSLKTCVTIWKSKILLLQPINHWIAGFTVLKSLWLIQWQIQIPQILQKNNWKIHFTNTSQEKKIHSQLMTKKSFINMSKNIWQHKLVKQIISMWDSEMAKSSSCRSLLRSKRSNGLLQPSKIQTLKIGKTGWTSKRKLLHQGWRTSFRQVLFGSKSQLRKHMLEEHSRVLLSRSASLSSFWW